MREAHYALGHLYLKRSSFDEALVEFQKELQLNPEMVLARYQIGKIYFQREKLDEAITELSRVVEADKTFRPAIETLAQARMKQGSINEAIALVGTCHRIGSNMAQRLCTPRPRLYASRPARRCAESVRNCKKIERGRTKTFGRRRQQALKTHPQITQIRICVICGCVLEFELEVELQSKLNLSRISRRKELSKLAGMQREFEMLLKTGSCRQSIRNRLEDVGKDRLVENVEELGAELKFVALREIEVLRQIHIRKELVREAERRTWRISNLPRQCRAKCKRIESRMECRPVGFTGIFSSRIADDVGTRTARRHSQWKAWTTRFSGKPV